MRNTNAISKEEIVLFLRERRGTKYSIRELTKDLVEHFPNRGVSYSTVMNRINILVERRDVNQKDYGVLRFIWVD